MAPTADAAPASGHGVVSLTHSPITSLRPGPRRLPRPLHRDRPMPTPTRSRCRPRSRRRRARHRRTSRRARRQGTRAAHTPHRRRGRTRRPSGARPAGVGEGGKNTRPPRSRLWVTGHDADGGLTHAFPDISQLAEIDPAHLAFPTRDDGRSSLLSGPCRRRHPAGTWCDWNRARQQLLALPGMGPWTAEIIAMRGLGDPDAFPASDLGVQLAAKRSDCPQVPRAHRAQRPMAALAGLRAQHLWTALDHEVNHWPRSHRRRSDGSHPISHRRQSGRAADPGRTRRATDASADGRPDL